MTTAYPLQWPQWQPRTPASKRQCGRFGTKRQERYGIQEISLHQACRRVHEALEKYTKPGKHWRVYMDAIVISTMLQVRKTDGLPKSGQRKPDDPGAAVYFELDDKPRVVACDSFYRLEDNIAAIAGVIEALRTIERYGSQMAEAAYTGFDALPPPDHIVGRTWKDVLEYYGDDIAEAKGMYLQKSKEAHPDHGGSSDNFAEVMQAWEQAQAELQGYGIFIFYKVWLMEKRRHCFGYS